MLRTKTAISLILLIGLVSMYPLAGLSEEMKGRFDMQGERPVVIADRVYLVTGSTQLVDLAGKRMSLDEIFPGRSVRVESFVGSDSSAPAIATRITVLEPH